MPDLHRDAFVMDGHTHVMTRELLLGTDIGQRYPDGNVDLPRAKEGGVDAMFFSVYTPENYYPGRFEIKNTFRVVELALDQIRKNEHAIGLALNASDIERITRSGRIAAFLDLEGGHRHHMIGHRVGEEFNQGFRHDERDAPAPFPGLLQQCREVVFDLAQPVLLLQLRYLFLAAGVDGAQQSGEVGRYDPQAKTWKTWLLPGNPGAGCYSVHVDNEDKVWLTDFMTNAIVRFDPVTEKFETFPSSERGAQVRQMASRPGEAWGAESGNSRLVLIKY